MSSFTRSRLRLLLLPCLAFGLSSCVVPRASSFRLQLDLELRERSKDSHWRNAKLSIARGVVEYSRTHGGRDPRPDIREKYGLSPASELHLIAFIRSRRLNRDVKELKPEASPGHSVRLKLDYSYRDVNTSAEIAGALNDWRLRKKGSPTNLKNTEYVNEVLALLAFLKKRLGYKAIEI